MRARSIAAAAVVVVLRGVAATQDLQRLTPSQARQHIGQTATVCGLVTVGRCQARTTLLDLRTTTGNSKVSVAIAPADRAAFGAGIEARHEMKDVCATGTIARDGGDVRVIVTRPDQLWIEREPAAGTAPAAIDAFTMCDENVTLPRVVREVPPRYTPDALNARIQGLVRLRGLVATDGRVQHVRVVDSLESGLDAQAREAFSQWIFTPGTRDGQPVPVLVTVELTFTVK